MLTEPAPPHPQPAMRWFGRVLPLVFPLVLLLFATYFLFGQIGYWSDDYFYNQRDPVTGQVDSLVMKREFFLRPLFYRIVPPMLTALWDHPWLLHLLQVLAHGGFCVLLFAFLRSFGASVHASAAAALLFMVYPVHFETVLWFSALPTLLACGVMVALLFIALWFARRAGPFAWAGGWWSVPVMMAVMFMVCALNEQPAAGIAAMPLIYLWAVFVERGEPFKRNLLNHTARALVPAALCSAVVILYTWMVISSAPEFSRGSPRSFVPVGEMWGRAVYFWDVVWRRLVMKNFASGASELGWQTLRSAPLWAIVWTGALVAGAVPFVRWWMRPAHSAQPEARRALPARVRGLWLVGIGIVIFITGFVPIMIFANHEPDSRMRYWPAVGLAMVVAGLLSLAEDRKRPVLRAGVLAVMLPLLIWFSVVFIGIQAAFQIRSERDRLEAAELTRLVPEPVPLTFFLPMAFERRAVQTGAPVFDGHFRGVWEFEWTGRRYLPHVYGRRDIHCGYFHHWSPRRPVMGADEDGIRYAHRLGPRFPVDGDGSRIPWELALPFTITADGQVRIITHIVIESEGANTTIAVPQAAGLPDFTATLPRR